MKVSPTKNLGFVAGLLVNILVFILSCAILAGVFGKAGQLYRETKDKNEAASEVYSLFAEARAEGIAAIDKSGDVSTSRTLVYYYNKSWQPAEGGTYAYEVRLAVTPQATAAGRLDRIEAVATDVKGNELCRMHTAVYAAGT